MPDTMLCRIEAKLDRLTEAQAAMLDLQRAQQRQLQQVVELLTPDKAEREGPTLQDLLAAILNRISEQSDSLSRIAATLAGTASSPRKSLTRLPAGDQAGGSWA